jgi:hypothetical protein
MEEDSLEDGALRDYFKKGKERKERKKRRKKRAAGDHGKGKEEDASGEQGEENHEGKQDHSDPSRLIYLNPSKEGILVSQNDQTQGQVWQNDQSGSGSVSHSPTSKSDQYHNVNLDDEEDLLDLDFSAPERITPPPPTGTSDDSDMNEEDSSNQAEDRFASHSQEVSQEESSISQSTITIYRKRTAAQEGEILYKDAPIFTIETYNQTVKASRQDPPLHK